MERTIHVTGQATISVKPDMIGISMTLEDTYENYGTTLEQSAAQVEILKDCFEKLGFKRTDLKTQYFNVDTAYENYQDDKGVWSRRFVGYKLIHRLRIEFDADNERLGQVLYGLAHLSVKPEFSIEHTLKDTEVAKNQLLVKAVEASKEKARIIAQAAGVRLGHIINIDYSWGNSSFKSTPMSISNTVGAEVLCMGEIDSFSMDIEAKNIEITDTVTVVWSIEYMKD